MNLKFKREIDIAVKKSTDKNYNIKEVAKILKVDYSGSFEDTCENIHKHLLKYKKNPEIKYFLSKFKKSDPNFCNILADSLYEFFRPASLGNKAPINMYESKYKELVKKRKEGDISQKENIILEKALHVKFCHCIKKLYLQNIINQAFFDKEPKYNPYAICTSSLYKKRDFDVPPSAARKCAKNYRWYKNTNYGKLKK